MAEQLHWEDVAEGTQVAPLGKNATRQQLVKYAGASGDFYQIHYDKDFALDNGLPGQIIHGALKSAWLGQLLSEWIGEEGSIKSYGCSYRGMDVPDEDLVCTGTVTKKYVEGDEHLVACDIWVENSKGDKTTPGTAVVALPSKG
jgi:acyl dehydratase